MSDLDPSAWSLADMLSSRVGGYAGRIHWSLRILTGGIPMPRYAPNKVPVAVRRRYFELIRTGLSGSEAAKRVGVSLSCGSLWFIDAGQVSFIESAISPRYLSQDDRIEIADGLCRGEPVKP